MTTNFPATNAYHQPCCVIFQKKGLFFNRSCTKKWLHEKKYFLREAPNPEYTPKTRTKRALNFRPATPPSLQQPPCLCHAPLSTNHHPATPPSPTITTTTTQHIHWPVLQEVRTPSSTSPAPPPFLTFAMLGGWKWFVCWLVGWPINMRSLLLGASVDSLKIHWLHSQSHHANGTHRWYL